MDIASALRHSVRSFSRTPGLALALIVSIALGIGSNAVLYGFVRGLIATTLANAGSIGAGETRLDIGTTPETAEALHRVGRLLSLAAGAVLLVACTNVAAFLLSRTSARARETSVRVALGASRAQLAALVLSDATVITAVGGTAGLLLANWTSSVLPALFFSEDAQHLSYTPDLGAIAISAAIGIAIVVASGLLPIAEMGDDRPAVVLQRENAGPSARMRRLRSGLVVLQIACCSALIISTALLWQSFRAAIETPSGQRLSNAILATLQVRPESPSQHELHALGLAYYHNVESAARAVPGVTSTAWVATVPGGAPVLQAFRIELSQATSHDVSLTSVAFTEKTVDIVAVPPLAGRMFGGQDTPGACTVGLVNEAAADAHFAGRALGRAVSDDEGRPIEIVGVVAMAKTDSGPTMDGPILFFSPLQGLDLRKANHFRVVEPSATEITLEANIVSFDYFSLVDLPVLAGAAFARDLTGAACGVAIVNQEASDRYFDGRAVGAFVIDAAGRRRQIVGIVPSSRLLALQRQEQPAIYFPMAQTFLPRMAMLIRAVNSDGRTLSTLRRRLEGIQGAFRPPAVVALKQHLNRTALAPLRIATVLVGGSAGMAMVLGVLGLAGVMAESARQRRREIALRIALGSQAWRVRRDLMSDGVRLAVGGLAIGALAAAVGARTLSQISPTIAPATAWAWLAAPLLILASVAVAGIVPVRRALITNPLAMLRKE